MIWEGNCKQRRFALDFLVWLNICNLVPTGKTLLVDRDTVPAEAVLAACLNTVKEKRFTPAIKFQMYQLKLSLGGGGVAGYAMFIYLYFSATALKIAH